MEVLRDMVAVVEGVELDPATTAGGGSSKDIWSGGYCEPSLLLISVDDAGVGGF